MVKIYQTIKECYEERPFLIFFEDDNNLEEFFKYLEKKNVKGQMKI